MTICHQIFALHEKRRKIDVICRRTMTPVQQISLDQLVPGQPRRSCLAITTIASVHNTIWLGTSNGMLMTIRDYIKPDKQYIVEDTFKPFYGPIIKIKVICGCDTSLIKFVFYTQCINLFANFRTVRYIFRL